MPHYKMIASYLIQKNYLEPFQYSYFPCKLYHRGEIFFPVVILFSNNRNFHEWSPFQTTFKDNGSVGSCVQSFRMAQKCGLRISDFGQNELSCLNNKIIVYFTDFLYLPPPPGGLLNFRLFWEGDYQKGG